VLTQKKKGEAELRVALQARVRAIQDVIAAQLEEEQADRNRADAANLDRWNAALTSVNEYARAIGLANEQIALEAALIGQSQQAAMWRSGSGRADPANQSPWPGDGR
jgi:hypothetical protein